MRWACAQSSLLSTMWPCILTADTAEFGDAPYHGGVTPTIAALLAIVLALIGVAGIVIPVLPGSITILAALAIWAVWGGGTQAIVVACVAGVAVLVGMLASAAITKKRLDAREIPRWPVVVALIAGVVAGFWIPAVGLPLGFALTLLACEWYRVRDLGRALSTSVAALKGIGIGMLVELACAMFAVTLLGASVFFALL